MELLLGSHVREHGNRIGRLAAFDLEPATHRIHRIVFSTDGQPGPDAMSRLLSAISMVHDNGEIELVPYSESAAAPDAAAMARLGPSTRLREGSRDAGPLLGIEVDAAGHEVVAVFGRHHWWSRRFSAPAVSADFRSPGEIRIATSGHQAA